VSNPENMANRLRDIIETHDVLRVKGFVEVAGKDMRMVVQAVGRRVEIYFDRDWQTDEARTSKLVVIGLHDMDADVIGKEIKAALV